MTALPPVTFSDELTTGSFASILRNMWMHRMTVHTEAGEVVHGAPLEWSDTFPGVTILEFVPGSPPGKRREIFVPLDIITRIEIGPSL